MILFPYIVTVFAWGTSWYAVQLQLGAVSPEVSVAYRFSLASVIMLGFCLVTGRSLRFSLRSHLAIVAQGLFLFGTNFYLIYRGSQNLPSGVVAILFSTVTIMNIAGGAVALQNRLEIRVLLGAIIGIAGVTTICWPAVQSIEAAPEVLTDIFFVLTGTAVAAIGMLISARNQRAGLPLTETNAVGMTYGAGFFVIYCFATGADFHVEWTVPYVGSLVYLTIVSTVIGFWSYLTLVGRIGPERASYTAVLFPLVALVISTVLEDFQWTLNTVIGTVLILTGNLFVLTRVHVQSRQDRPKQTRQLKS